MPHTSFPPNITIFYASRSQEKKNIDTCTMFCNWFLLDPLKVIRTCLSGDRTYFQPRIHIYTFIIGLKENGFDIG